MCLLPTQHDDDGFSAPNYDLEKAFDSVDQTLLLSKLVNSGLNGPMLATIKSFLSNRKVCIQVNDYIDMSLAPLNGLL